MENQKTHQEILEKLERNAKHLRIVYGLSIIAIALVLTVLAPKIIKISSSLESQNAPDFITPTVQHKLESKNTSTTEETATTTKRAVAPY